MAPIKSLSAQEVSTTHGWPVTPKSDESLKWFELSYGGRTQRGVFRKYYRIPIENQARAKNGAVFIATRGISSGDPQHPEKGPLDTFDLHSQPESYILIERMIANLLLPQPNEVNPSYVDYSQQLNKEAKCLVNSDQVYLLGFSAGGDGVYQLSTNISDRFAAVHAGGGHPNAAKFANLANLLISIQVGENDYFQNGQGTEFPRAPPNIAVSNALDNMQRGLSGEYYWQKCSIVRDGRHNEWSQPDKIDQAKPVLKNLGLWYMNGDAPWSEGC